MNTVPSLEEPQVAHRAAMPRVVGGGLLPPGAAAAREPVLAAFRLFERMPALAAVTAPDGALYYLNATGRRMLGGATSLFEQYTDESRELLRARAIPAAMRHGAWCGETAIAAGDGEPIPLWQVTMHHPGEGEGLLSTLAWDISGRKDQERDLWHQATHDALTGLPNRALIMDRLTQAIHGAQRSTHFTAVLLMDVDGFKEVNDRHGHETGNRLLAELAVRLYACVRARDTIGRYGGDEFVIVLGELNGSEEVLQVQRRIHAALADPFVVGEARLQVGASIGLAIHPDDGADAESLLRHADQSMYRAKERRRARPGPGDRRATPTVTGPTENPSLVSTP